MPTNAPLLTVWTAIVPTIQNMAPTIAAAVSSAGSAPAVQTAAGNAGQQAGNSFGSAAGGVGGQQMVAGLMAAIAAAGIGAAVMDNVQQALTQEKVGNKLAAALNLDSAQKAEIEKATQGLWTSGLSEDYAEISEVMQQIVGSVKGAKDMSAGELEEMGAQVMNLADVYGIAPEMIATSIQSMIGSGFAKDMDEAVSIILGGYQTMGAGGEDWVESLNEFSGAFKLLGIDGPKSINLVNAALNAGAKDSDAFADAMLEIGIKINDGSADDALTTLGFDVNKVKENMAKGGDVAYAQYMEILNKLQDTGNRDLFANVIGTKSEDYFNAFQNMDLSSVNAQLDEGVGNMDKFMDANSSVEQSWLALKNTVTQVFVDNINPILEELLPILNDITTYIGENEWAVMALAVVMGGMFLVAIAAATAALWGMIAPVLANPLTWFILGAVAAIGLVIFAITQLVTHWDSGVKAASEIWAVFVGWITGTVATIGDWFVNLGHSIANFFIGIVNGIITGLNWVLELINSIQIDMPEWLGGGTVGFDVALVDSIPEMAQGGVVQPRSGGVLTKLAEAGKPEAVVDEGLLNRNLELQNAAWENGGNSQNPVTVNVYPQQGQSEEEIANIVVRELDWRSLRG